MEEVLWIALGFLLEGFIFVLSWKVMFEGEGVPTGIAAMFIVAITQTIGNAVVFALGAFFEEIHAWQVLVVAICTFGSTVLVWALYERIVVLFKRLKER